MQPWGEIQYATEVPGEGGQVQELPYTGNFSTVDFTYWPDRKTYEALELEPPGFIQGKDLTLVWRVVWIMVDLFAGIFLSCPGCVGGKRYVLYAMTPTFQCGGCITLDRLVYKGRGDDADQVTSDIDGHEGL